MKSFKEFLNEKYLSLESIEYLDRTIFRPFLAGKYDMTDAQLKEWRNKQNLIKEDDDKYWLENDEEIELIKQYQADPNSPEGRAAMNKLVENKIPYVKSKVGKFIAAHPEWRHEKEDMEQEALIAVTTAVEKFDPSQGTIFNGFLNKYITGTLYNHNNPARQKSIVNGKGDSYGRDKVYTVSMDSTVGGDNGEWADKEESIQDKIADDRIRKPWEETPEEEAEHVSILHDWYETLPEKKKTMMMMHFPTDPDQKPATYEEIGNVVGMSKMGVQKAIQGIIIELRKMAEQAGFCEPGDTEKDPDFYENIYRAAIGKKKKASAAAPGEGTASEA